MPCMAHLHLKAKTSPQQVCSEVLGFISYELMELVHRGGLIFWRTLQLACRSG